MKGRSRRQSNSEGSENKAEKQRVDSCQYLAFAKLSLHGERGTRLLAMPGSTDIAFAPLPFFYQEEQNPSHRSRSTNNRSI